jgi:tetratricopeptide (TPR) repeat protein
MQPHLNEETLGVASSVDIARNRSVTQSKAKFVRWLPPVLIILLTVTAFFPVLQNDFVNWDDDVNIVQNVNYRGLGWAQLRWMFTNLSMGHYQPLSWVTLGLDYVLWGMDPFGYHLTNLILHAVNAVIFYFVALSLLSAAFRDSPAAGELALRFAAGFAALLFALHPLRVESVAWVTERRGLLAGLFFLSSVLYYLRANAVGEGNAARLRWMLAAVTAYGLSLLSKASGLGLPVVLLALDVYPLGRLSSDLKEWWDEKNRKVLREKIPFLVLALVAVVLALMAEQQRGAVRLLSQYGMILRIEQAFFGLTFYLWKTLVPSGLFPMYAGVTDAVPAYWLFHPIKGILLALGIIVALAVSVALFFLRRRSPAGLAGWVYYVAMLAPVLGIVRIGDHIAADRYSYLACLAWAVLAAGAVVYCRRYWGHGRPYLGAFVFAGGLAALLIGLGALAWKQAQVWHDSETLFRHMIAVSPNSIAAHNNLGIILGSRGQLDEAIGHYRLVLQTDPDDSDAHFNLGLTLSAQGKLDEAIGHYRHFLQLDHARNYFRLAAYQSLGILLARQGKLEEAAESYRQALEIEPDFEEAHNNLGSLLAGLGRTDEAIEHFQKALLLNPRFALAHANLGDALMRRGRFDAAIEHYRKALEIDPGMLRAQESLRKASAGRGVSGQQGPTTHP